MAEHERESSTVLRALGLPEPVSRVLKAPEAAPPSVLASNWERISGRLGQQSTSGRRRRGARPLLVALAASVFALGLWWRMRTTSVEPVAVAPVAPEPSEPLVSGVPAPATPSPIDESLHLRGGGAFTGFSVAELTTAADPTSQVTFEDGSTLTALSPNTQVDALAVTARDVLLRLVNGSVDVHVQKGGPRKWTIEAGELSVEVVGTRFVVSRRTEVARVEVVEGVVLVRSSKLPEGAVRLEAGQHVSVKLRGERSAPSVDELFAQADAARKAGELPVARDVLRRLVREHGSDARAGLAAYQLAVIDEQLGASRGAVVAGFERALRAATGASLRQDCLWRLTLATEHAGDQQATRKYALQYLSEFPKGRYAVSLDRKVAEWGTVNESGSDNNRPLRDAEPVRRAP